MNLTLLSEDKKLSGDLSGEDGLLGREMRKDLLQAVVRWQLACRRAGTVKTKTKGEVRGGGKKPFKQKGTGNARQGSSRSPLMPGGGTAFGPQPRDYSYTLPRKVKQAGLATALSYLNAEKRLWVVDGFKTDGKSKQLALALDKAGVAKAILCDDGKDVKLNCAARNLRKYKHLPAGGLNVFDLLKYDGCVITKEALKQLSERLEGADGK